MSDTIYVSQEQFNKIKATGKGVEYETFAGEECCAVGNIIFYNAKKENPDNVISTL